MLTTNHAGCVKIVINKRRDREDLLLKCIKPRFVEDYIIPLKHSSIIRSKGSFPSTYGNKHFCGDTLNSRREDQKVESILSRRSLLKLICGGLYYPSQAFILSIIWSKGSFSSTYGNNSTTFLWRYIEHFQA
jgi:hypothetical protein